MARCARALQWDEQADAELEVTKVQVQPSIDAMLENAKNLDQVAGSLARLRARARLGARCALLLLAAARPCNSKRS
jgi:hypothetical protein